MDNSTLKLLVAKAGEMALNNEWGEKAYKTNIAILKLDQGNCAAYTRLAKYYKLTGNISEAKNMYLMALEINPNNRGAINNLLEMERDEKENEEIDKIKSINELIKEGQKSMLKGKYNLASKLFSKAFSYEPILAYAVNLAGALKKLGKYDEIEAIYSQLIEQNRLQANVDNVNKEFSTLRAAGIKL